VRGGLIEAILAGWEGFPASSTSRLPQEPCAQVQEWFRWTAAAILPGRPRTPRAWAIRRACQQQTPLAYDAERAGICGRIDPPKHRIDGAGKASQGSESSAPFPLRARYSGRRQATSSARRAQRFHSNCNVRLRQAYPPWPNRATAPARSGTQMASCIRPRDRGAIVSSRPISTRSSSGSQARRAEGRNIECFHCRDRTRLTSISPTRFAAPLPASQRPARSAEQDSSNSLNGHFHHLSERITARGSPDQSAFVAPPARFGFPPCIQP